MVTGIDSFREWFRGFEDQYVIIGGTACDILMTEEGIDFRSTRDIDLVLLIEAITADFGRKFWEFVKAVGYKLTAGKAHVHWPWDERRLYIML